MTATACDPVATVGTGHILLVEDDQGCREAYSRALRKAGYAVSTAADFRLALEILEAEGPLDLLMVDIVMPGSVNGLALSRMARMRRKDLKVLYVTGYSIPGVEREALGPILLKPVDDERLVGEVGHVLADTITQG
jgi:DNA-binding NtrC family response regulator